MNPPNFFIPQVPEEKWEEVYEKFARLAGARPASPGRRVRSITFSHNGETWTATVGEPLSGTVEKIVRRGGQRIERMHSLSNPSIILAIFEGHPFQIWHDERSRQWANPFMAGDVVSISYFAG